MRGTTRLVSAGLLCIVSIARVPNAEAYRSRYQSSCWLKEERDQLKLNASSGQYYEAQTNRNDTISSRALSEFVKRENGSEYVARKYNSPEESTWIEARACSCFLYNHTIHYCPSFSEMCENPERTELEAVRCLGMSPYRNGLRRIMFIGLLWALGIVGLLLFSGYGISISNMILSSIIPRYSNFLVNRILKRDPEAALRMMTENVRFRRRMRRRRPGTGPEWRMDARAVRQLRLTRRLQEPLNRESPVALRLKTRMYKETGKIKDSGTVKSDDSSEEEDALDECAICYQELRTGDRVGDIRCGHVFHAGCLKQWCVRRNACPYCQLNDIAEPQLSCSAQDTEILAGGPTVQTDFGL